MSCSTARALFTNRVAIHINNLPEDVLLEIFDAYRQLHQLHPLYELHLLYELLWDSRNGWFKLAHVCLRWRRLVFLSTSRLQVHLRYIPGKSSSEPVLTCLPRLPILVDYSTVCWTEKNEKLVLAAIVDRSRVRGIALVGPCASKLIRELCHPFPKLESFKFGFPSYCHDKDELILPATFLLPAPCLRRLTLRKVVPTCLSPLLSSATGLVELALTLRVGRGALPDASLITNLQRLSCLRRLELRLNYQDITTIPHSSPSPTDIVTLSKLTDFIFEGHAPYLEMLVVRLATPSLHYLDAEVWGGRCIFPILNLCKRIRDAGCQFRAVRLDILQRNIEFSAETNPKPRHWLYPPFRIAFPEPDSLVPISNTLSGPLSTVEQFRVVWSAEWTRRPPRIQWHDFFNYIPNVKIVVHMTAKVALDVLHSFQLESEEPAMDLLPALEHIRVYFTQRSSQYKSTSLRSAYDALISARQRAGRPIEITWANIN